MSENVALTRPENKAVPSTHKNRENITSAETLGSKVRSLGVFYTGTEIEWKQTLMAFFDLNDMIAPLLIWFSEFAIGPLHKKRSIGLDQQLRHEEQDQRWGKTMRSLIGRTRTKLAHSRRCVRARAWARKEVFFTQSRQGIWPAMESSEVVSACGVARDVNVHIGQWSGKETIVDFIIEKGFLDCIDTLIVPSMDLYLAFSMVDDSASCWWSGQMGKDRRRSQSQLCSSLGEFRRAGWPISLPLKVEGHGEESRSF